MFFYWHIYGCSLKKLYLREMWINYNRTKVSLQSVASLKTARCVIFLLKRHKSYWAGSTGMILRLPRIPTWNGLGLELIVLCVVYQHSGGPLSPPICRSIPTDIFPFSFPIIPLRHPIYIFLRFSRSVFDLVLPTHSGEGVHCSSSGLSTSWMGIYNKNKSYKILLSSLPNLPWAQLTNQDRAVFNIKYLNFVIICRVKEEIVTQADTMIH